eukprot:3107417-Prymnesium_polylepis.1
MSASMPPASVICARWPASERHASVPAAWTLRSWDGCASIARHAPTERASAATAPTVAATHARLCTVCITDSRRPMPSADGGVLVTACSSGGTPPARTVAVGPPLMPSPVSNSSAAAASACSSGS